MDRSDHDLLAAYHKGDVEAMATLVERYRRQLFGYIVGMIGGVADADEVFQEVWFRVVRGVGGYTDRNFGGWLVRIAHNLIIDRVRRRKPEVSLDADWEKDGFGGFELKAPEQDAMQALSARELGAKIAAAVLTLPEKQKEVFLMRTQLNMPFREIARAQRTSLGTALARMHYALGKLRDLLQEEYRAVAGSAAPGGGARP